MPRNAVYVGRGSKWGNPFKIGSVVHGLIEHNKTTALTREDSLRLYKIWLNANLELEPDFLDKLEGRDLVCWCPLNKECHADILLALANR
jgi:hypothetical protein